MVVELHHIRAGPVDVITRRAHAAVHPSMKRG
jgi:hypothetical protein